MTTPTEEPNPFSFSAFESSLGRQDDPITLLGEWHLQKDKWGSTRNETHKEAMEAALASMVFITARAVVESQNGSFEQKKVIPALLKRLKDTPRSISPEQATQIATDVALEVARRALEFDNLPDLEGDLREIRLRMSGRVFLAEKLAKVVETDDEKDLDS